MFHLPAVVCISVDNRAQYRSMRRCGKSPMLTPDRPAGGGLTLRWKK
jgi:hypothetical protein